MTIRRTQGMAALVLGAALALAGCGTAALGADTAPVKVASVATQDDGSPGIITLSEAAERRLGVETVTVAAGPDGLVVPYAAVVYEADGSSWVFVRTEPLTYQRSTIEIAGIDGDQARLTSGPAAGTEVVTVGAAELVGVEIGIDGEE